MILPLSWALLLALVLPILADSIATPSNIESQIFTLHPLSNITIPNQLYSLTFASSSFSTLPTFACSLNDLKNGNTFAHQYLFISTANLTAKSVGLMVVTDNTTKVYKLSVNYMAIWNLDSIFVHSKSYSNMSNLTSGSNTRYYRVYETNTFTTDNATTALAFIRGFYITSTVASKLLITVIVVSTANYLVYIQTSADCIVKIASFDILFYYPTLLTSQAYYYAVDTTSFCSPSPNPATYSRSLANYNKSAFIVGLYGFYMYSAVNITLGWSVSNVSDSTATLLFNKPSIQNLYYSYFQIWVVSQTPVYNNTNSQSAAEAASPDKGNYLGIIAGLIGGVAVVAVGVVLFVKWYFKTTIYITPEKDDFRMLPAISV